MFITYGDTFLPSSNSYDELYYEIVRMHQVFDNLYCMGMYVCMYVRITLHPAFTSKQNVQRQRIAEFTGVI